MLFPFPTDLFGEVPVTWVEIHAWCDQITWISPTPWRRDWYIENWNVAEKIRHAKLNGTFNQEAT